LAERVLLNNGKWFPSDGYGFSVTLKEYLGGLNGGKQINYSPSKTKVLKLHGSIGWHNRQEVFYLRYSSYLQYLIANVCDENAPYPSGPDEDPVMLYPSYLKQLDNPILLSVWEQARKALEAASSVTIVGYSLPLADVAIRTLLLPIRTNDATIKIISPTSEKSDERKRWECYFKSSGKEPEFVKKEAAAYFV
jgi:hypothetical protein